MIITKSVTFRGDHIDNLLIAHAKTLCDQLDKTAPGNCEVEIKTERGALKGVMIVMPTPEDLGGVVTTGVTLTATEVKEVLIKEAMTHVPANFREVDKVGFEFDTADLIKIATIFFSKKP